ncbi:MAG: hypothetical protein KGZ39_04065 [Simkania sp.]|nr:hypothetical protein [Simkania sp.]
MQTTSRGSIACWSHPPPQLSKKSIDHLLQTARLAFEERWRLFSDAYPNFTPFTPERPDKDLKEEFLELKKTRDHIYYTDPAATIRQSQELYDISLPLIFENYLRMPSHCAFAYNNTSPFLNASTLSLNEKSYIACEGPRSADITRFFTFLATHGVSHLVRLTPAFEADVKKCHPYWESSVKETSGALVLKVPIAERVVYPIQYYIEEHWEDHKSLDPTRLLELVTQVKQDIEKSSDSLLAVHCSLGIGRTCTFFAAMMILAALQKQEPFSIQQIVFQLSLQRMHGVSTAEQYISLYRFAEVFLQKYPKGSSLASSTSSPREPLQRAAFAALKLSTQHDASSPKRGPKQRPIQPLPPLKTIVEDGATSLRELPPEHLKSTSIPPQLDQVPSTQISPHTSSEENSENDADDEGSDDDASLELKTP